MIKFPMGITTSETKHNGSTIIWSPGVDNMQGIEWIFYVSDETSFNGAWSTFCGCLTNLRSLKFAYPQNILTPAHSYNRHTRVVGPRCFLCSETNQLKEMIILET